MFNASFFWPHHFVATHVLHPMPQDERQGNMATTIVKKSTSRKGAERKEKKKKNREQIKKQKIEEKRETRKKKGKKGRSHHVSCVRRLQSS